MEEGVNLAKGSYTGRPPDAAVRKKFMPAMTKAHGLLPAALHADTGMYPGGAHYLYATRLLMYKWLLSN